MTILDISDKFINVYRYRGEITRTLRIEYEGFESREDAAREAAETCSRKCSYVGTLERTETGWIEVDLEDYGYRLIQEDEADEETEERHIREISSPYLSGRI